jgi:uncharacterized protein involved in exopolysaccharide biosynthesis
MQHETHDRLDGPQPIASKLRSILDDESIDLRTLWLNLRAGKRTILLSALAGLVLAAIVAFLTPNIYTATASFITPVASGSGLSSVSSQLSMLGAIGLQGSFKDPGDMYIGLLRSKTVAQHMVTRFNLKHVYGAKTETAAEKALASQSIFDPGIKDDIISISVMNHDPKLAQDMANAYLDELHIACNRLALTEASQRRLFFEQQMNQEKDSLENAEVELRKTQEQTGLIAPMPQTSLELQGIANTRENIEAREVELAGMLQGSTEQDPAVIRLRSEIAGLKNQLQQMMNGNGSNGPSAAKVPEIQLEYVRRQREVSYHETLFEILARQYEAARLDESHDAPMLQIVDQASLPDTKSSPHRATIGAVGSTIWVLFRIRIRALLQSIS